MTLVQALQQFVIGWEHAGLPALGERFALRNGLAVRRGAKRPKGVRKLAYKLCYRNATMQTLQTGMRYAEGFAMHRDLGLPLAHAWNIDHDGNVLDLTWRDPEQCEYKAAAVVGEHELARRLARSQFYGLLDVDRQACRDFMFEIDPTLEAEMMAIHDRLLLASSKGSPVFSV